MQIRITRWTGSLGNGIVLAAYGSTIRVAIPGCDDTEEFLCRGGHWFSDDGEPVEIDFPAVGGAENDFDSASNKWAETGCLSPNSLPAQAVAWIN
jgi:hypothetical protein